MLGSVAMTSPSEPAPRTRGRPRSEVARQAILDATQTLLETATVRELTIEAIAKKAGVGKSTIYRWWPSKAAIVIDTFFESMAPLTSFSPSESVSDAISQQIGRLIDSYRGRSGRIVAEIIAEGQTDPEVLADFREHYLLRRRAAARELVEHGKTTGELDPHFDSDLMCDLIYGSIYYRLLVGHLPLDDAFAQMLPQQMLSALQRGASDTASQPDSSSPS